MANIDVAGYIALSRETWFSLFENSGLLRDYLGRNVLTTWTLSYQELRKTYQDVAQMLQLWSYFHHRDLWYKLFMAVLGRKTVPKAELPEWYVRSTCNILSFNRVIQAQWLNFSQSFLLIQFIRRFTRSCLGYLMLSE